MLNKYIQIKNNNQGEKKAINKKLNHYDINNQNDLKIETKVLNYSKLWCPNYIKS